MTVFCKKGYHVRGLRIARVEISVVCSLMGDDSGRYVVTGPGNLTGSILKASNDLVKASNDLLKASNDLLKASNNLLEA